MIDCNLVQQTATAKPATQATNTGMKATAENTQYEQLKAYFGKRYSCFYYKNTVYNSDKAGYYGGTFVPIASDPYYIDSEGNIKKRLNYPKPALIFA